MMKLLRVRAGRATLFGAVGLALLVAASAGFGSGTGRAAPRSAAPVSLKVMVFNIEYGGTQISFAKVAQAIKKSGADVVGIEEAWGHIPRLAQQLGWPYYDNRLQIVSRYPLVDPPGGNGIYTFVQVAPGQVVAMENVHLPSSPYGPNWVRNGKTRAQVLAMERRVRLPAIQDQLAALPGLTADDIPVFLTGDFNAPSYRDWTKACVGTRKYLRYSVKWPVSVAVEAAGFHDSFRDIYPDPVKDPGLTWWARPATCVGLEPRAARPAGPHRLRLRGGRGHDHRQPHRRREGRSAGQCVGQAMALRPPRRRLHLRGHAGRAAGAGSGRPAAPDGRPGPQGHVPLAGRRR